MAKIVLDARLTRQMSVGMKTYVRELVARLPKAAGDLEFAIIDEGFRNVSWGEQVALPRRARSTGAALAHFMSVYAPRWPGMPYVYTIHDLIHRRFPRSFSWKIPPYYALVAGPVARGARAVLTDAYATIEDLERYLRVNPDRVRVVPLGVGDAFGLGDAQRARARWNLVRPYFLYAGNHRPHKNLAVLATAWRNLEEPCDLVITEDGPLDFDPGQRAKPNGRLLATGHVELRELADLYAGCAAAVQPSLYEGFGLSVLEAMRAGAPVVVARTPALLEVAGDAAPSFEPQDSTALAQLMRAMLRDPATASAWRQKGFERAAGYSWDQTARMTAHVYRECLGG